MDNEFIQSKASFGFHLHGENEIDALILSKTISDMAELTKLTAQQENPEAYLKMNVTAFKNGSFEIAFSAICELANRIGQDPVTAAALAGSIVGSVKGVFEIKKLIGGESPKSVTKIDDHKIKVENTDGQSIVVPNSSGIVLNNVRVDQLTVNISNNIKQHNANGGFTFSLPGEDLICSAEDVNNISKSLPIEEETVCRRSRFEADLPIKKADFLGSSAWEFKYKDRTIKATISDEVWADEIHSGKLSVKADDYITATVEVYVDLDMTGKPISGSEKYSIIKVHGGIKHNIEQIPLV